MNASGFLKDKASVITINIVCAVLLALFLYALGVGVGELALILVCWAGVIAAMLISDYFRRKKQFDSLFGTLDRLEQKYLLSDLMEAPQSYEDALWAQVLRQTNKSMLEQVSRLRLGQEEYRGYIEQWVHEVKTPLAAMKLTCENNKSDATRRLAAELEKTEHYIDQALYYARSGAPEKDYIVRETPLLPVVERAVSANKRLLMGNGLRVEVDCPHTVKSDGKWVGFMLEQLILNSVKYGAKEVRFASREDDAGVTLAICDDGMGIGPDELPRVFDKGFTGTNGRKNASSTGIGLYLCKRLCDKLGLGIWAQSQPGNGFEVSIFFAKSNFHNVL